MMKERLTFGFKNTEILFGVLVYLLIFLVLLLFSCRVDFNGWGILTIEAVGGIVFGLVFRADDSLNYKGYLGSYVWAVALVFPFTFLVYKFRWKGLVEFINKI